MTGIPRGFIEQPGPEQPAADGGPSFSRHREGATTKPYRTIADLPKAQTDQYNPHQKKAFLEAFNSAYEKYKDDEGHAFAIAHSAAKKAGEKPGPG
jgi:cation transport regulator